MNLEILESKFSKKYYNNLIKYCKKTNQDYSFFKKQLEKMNAVDISLTETESNESIQEKILDKQSTDSDKYSKKYNGFSATVEVNSEGQEIKYSEDYLYKKPWTKLTNVHKMIKIKEFVNKLLITNENDKEELKKKLVGLIKTKKLTKKDMVKYDSINGRVIAIPILKYKNGKYLVKSK